MPGTATLGCTLPEATVRPAGGPSGAARRRQDHRGGRAGDADDYVDVRVLDCLLPGSRLRSGKGINLPDTDLDVPIVTAADRPLLEFVARRADMVALSFLRQEGDIEMVREELRAVCGSRYRSS